jgi:hypothetical protein
MNTIPNNQNKNMFTFIKIFLASVSLTSLIGLWSFFNKNSQETSSTATPSPETALPTLVPSVLDNQTAAQELLPVTQVTPQAIATPVIEKVVVSSSGRSGGGSASKTSSSR